MKNFVCVLCLLTISVVFLSGCKNESVNPFLDENAIKGQIGDLYYVVPYNATADEKNDNNIMYSVPIENSEENYQLGLMYMYVSEDEANEEEVKSGFETILNNIATEFSNFESKGMFYESEQITDFLGIAVDSGIKYTAEYEGKKIIGIAAFKSRKMYVITYRTKTGFYNQSVWDNFYAQLELV